MPDLFLSRLDICKRLFYKGNFMEEFDEPVKNLPAGRPERELSG